MSKYILNIKLLSDMCVSDGGVYNSQIDIDVCYDRFGFPYIPAKRLKGCLRECALELNDWGMSIDIKSMFGDKGEASNSGAVRIGNACLDNLDNLREIINNSHNLLVYHPQNVLSVYTRLRSQTSIDNETGVAVDGSLRTTRVVNKGKTFCAQVDIPEKYVSDFENCVRSLTQIGMSRTRGLGEIKATLKKIDVLPQEAKLHYSDDISAIKYTINLEEPMICKSIRGGEERSNDYIDGAKMLGFIVSKVRESGANPTDFLNSGKLICTNGYVSVDGTRYEEVPANIYEIKNKKTPYVDKYTETDVKEQINPMKHCYILRDADGILHKQSVLLEERYHHRRPEDKSIGRARDDGSGDSTFYQMSSIEAGQNFSGYIYGTSSQLSTICNLVSENEEGYMGYSRTSEYGKVGIKFEPVSFNAIEKQSSDIIVRLVSPTIVYNDKATYAVSIEDLVEEVLATLATDSDNVASIDQFVNFTTVGGFNTRWNYRKPTIVAYDKGTTLRIRFNNPVTIKNSTYFIGERISEGYGEARIEAYSSRYADVKDFSVASDSEDNSNYSMAADNELANKICKSLMDGFVVSKAMEIAKAINPNESYRATVSNMIIMCSEQDSLEEVRDSVNSRFEKNSLRKTEKKDKANVILSKVEQAAGTLSSEFLTKYKLSSYEGISSMKMELLHQTLIQIKYIIREKTNKKGDSSNE